MRMKEDAMGNGQLKPAYNLQHSVDSLIFNIFKTNKLSSHGKWLIKVYSFYKIINNSEFFHEITYKNSQKEAAASRSFIR